MRTSVDLPPALYDRVKQLSVQRGQSLSKTIAELTLNGVASLGDPVAVGMDSVSGLPVLSLGRRVTDEDVARLLDDQ